MQSVISGAAYKGDKTKTTGKTNKDHNKEIEKEKRFSIDFAPKKRVVYSFVTDRNRFVPRKPRLYRAYIVKRPLIVPQTTTENAQGRQTIPYIDALPTFPYQQLSRDHTLAAQPLFYYQEPNEQQLPEFEEPLEEETFPEVPGEFSGTFQNKLIAKWNG